MARMREDIACVDPNEYQYRGAGWSRLTVEQRDFIVTWHSRGEASETIVYKFMREFGEHVRLTVVEWVIREEGLPRFRSSGRRRCDGCGAGVVSSPCVACTVRGMVKQQKVIGKR